MSQFLKVKLAKYEHIDKTGMRHPSIVVLDITNNRFCENDDLINDKLPILQVREIYSTEDYFNREIINKRKLPRIKGYKFEWHYRIMNSECYALFLGYSKIGT